LREITHSQTFVVPGSFSLIMNLSDFGNLSSANLFESFFKNVTDSIMDAFKHVVSTQSVHTLSGTDNYKVHQESGHIVFTASALLVAFNFNSSATFDDWNSLAVSIFHSKTSSPAIRDLVSPQTLQARTTCFVLWFCVLCLGGFRRFLTFPSVTCYVIVSIYFVFLRSNGSTAHPAQFPPCIKFHYQHLNSALCHSCSNACFHLFMSNISTRPVFHRMVRFI
jgi:hypothetical protein